MLSLIMQKKVWFKAKLFGWGWYPSTWEGWLIIALYLGAIFAHLYVVGALDDSLGKDIHNAKFSEFFPWLLVYTGLLVWISYKKGEKPRWRWGK